jgi:hypothetical protein
MDGVVWTGLIWFRIGTCGGPLRKQQNFQYNKMGNSSIGAQLASSQEGLISMEIVLYRRV